MTDPERIRIDRAELHTREVDEALARERALTGRTLPPPESVSPLRRLLLTPLFYLPVAGFVGAFVAWLFIEPRFDDYATIGGEVVLVNSDPFDLPPGLVALTVGDKEVIVSAQDVRFEPGTDGQPPIRGVDHIEPGQVVEVAGIPVDERPDSVAAIAIRPATEAHARATGSRIAGQFQLAGLLLFPATGGLVALMLLLAEGLSSRNWRRTFERTLIGTLLGTVFSFLALIPGGLLMVVGGQLAFADSTDTAIVTVHDLGPSRLLIHIVARSLAWASVGAAVGLGMNLARSTKGQLKSSLLGGILGGAMGGLFFDPIDRFLETTSPFDGAETSRMVGLAAVGLCIGVFVAVTERLVREAWLVVRSGPLAGKAFVLYRTPTVLGSSPRSEVYLFKDAEIDPSHAAIHRAGSAWEIEDLGTRAGTRVGGRVIRRQRLASGDQIALGGTVLEFEERAKRGKGAAP